MVVENGKKIAGVFNVNLDFDMREMLALRSRVISPVICQPKCSFGAAKYYYYYLLLILIMNKYQWPQVDTTSYLPKVHKVR